MDDRSPSDPDDLPEELISLVKPELEPGERLLWASRAGSGSPSSLAEPSLWAWVWFLGFLTVSLGSFVGIPILASLRQEGGEGLLLVIGILCGVICCFFVVGHLSIFLAKRSERRKIDGQIYALTDRRAVIWLPGSKSSVSVHTFQRGTIKGTDLHRVQYPDGSGDVLLRNTYQQPSGFLGIAEVRRVEELVRRFLVVPGPGTSPDIEST